MKKTEREAARLLRVKGFSMNEIVLKLAVSKSSVSLWVRDVELTDKQKKEISLKGRSVNSIELRRNARLKNERQKRAVLYTAAILDVDDYTKRDLLILGLGLYWGEGAKTMRGSASFFNSDPRIIQVMMRFYREVCEIPEIKFRGHVHLHPHLNNELAEKYWSEISGIPQTQFQKTSMQHNKASKNKKDSLPLGTFTIGVYDTSLYLKIMGWTEGAYSKLIPKNKQIESRYLKYL